VDQLDRRGCPDRTVTGVGAGTDQDQHGSKALTAGSERRGSLVGEPIVAVADDAAQAVLHHTHQPREPRLRDVEDAGDWRRNV
jgi:hypothetical protein